MEQELKLYKDVEDLHQSKGSKLVNISLAVSKKNLKIMTYLMYEKGISRSELMRRALDLYVEKEIKNEKKKDVVVVKYNAVQLYMKENGYNHIRRLE